MHIGHTCIWTDKAQISIGLDKSGYQVNSFLISQYKHMLWVLIEALLMSTHNICF